MSDLSEKGFVLVVDDSLVNLRLGSEILKKEGYQVHTISDAVQVESWVIENQPDLILLDIMMPEITGIELCQKLKQNPKTKSIPVIFLTAKVGHESTVEALHAGGGDYVLKPFHSEELVARVHVHLRLYQNEKALAERNLELQKSLDEIAKLSQAMVKICAWTKQVEIDGKWVPIEEYLSKYLGLSLTHGISQEGVEKLGGSV